MPIPLDIKKELTNLLEPELLTRLLANSTLKTVDRGKIIVEIRDSIHYIPLVLKGHLKVERRDGSGNGVFLHYIKPLEICPISFYYGLNNQKSDIRCSSESQVTYLAIPLERANSWYHKYKSWRDYIAKLTQQQQAKLMTSIDNAYFQNIESRLTSYLKERLTIEKSNIITLKHQEIAFDLKASRETISRALKKLEKEGKLELGRNRITILH